MKLKRLPTALRVCSHIGLGFMLSTFLNGRIAQSLVGAVVCLCANVAMSRLIQKQRNTTAQAGKTCEWEQREIERLTAEQRAIDAAIPNEPRYGIDLLDRITAVVANMQAAYARSTAWEEMERERDAVKVKLRAVEALRDELSYSLKWWEPSTGGIVDSAMRERKNVAAKLTAILTPQEGA